MLSGVQEILFLMNQLLVILADDLIEANPGCMKQMIENWDGGNMVATMEC